MDRSLGHVGRGPQAGQDGSDSRWGLRRLLPRPSWMASSASSEGHPAAARAPSGHGGVRPVDRASRRARNFAMAPSTTATASPRGGSLIDPRRDASGAKSRAMREEQAVSEQVRPDETASHASSRSRGLGKSDVHRARSRRRSRSKASSRQVGASRGIVASGRRRRASRAARPVDYRASGCRTRAPSDCRRRSGRGPGFGRGRRRCARGKSVTGPRPGRFGRWLHFSPVLRLHPRPCPIRHGPASRTRRAHRAPRPLPIEHLDDLAAVAFDQGLWAWTWSSRPIDPASGLAARRRSRTRLQGRGARSRPSTRRPGDRQYPLPVASCPRPAARDRLDLGRARYQRTGANRDAKLLQLTHAFESSARTGRVEDGLAQRKANLPARYRRDVRGMFRNHMVMPGGRLGIRTTTA